MQIANGGEDGKNSAKCRNKTNKKVGVTVVRSSKCSNQILNDELMNLFETKIENKDAQLEYKAVQKTKNFIPNSPIEIKHIDKEIEFTVDDFLSDNENILLENNTKELLAKDKENNKKQLNTTEKKKGSNDSFASLISPQRKNNDKDINLNFLNEYNQLQMINKIEMMKDFEKMKQLKDLEKVQKLLEIDKAKQLTQNISYSNNNNMMPITQPIHYPIPQGMIPQSNQNIILNPWDYQQQMAMYILWQQQQFLQYQYYTQMRIIYPSQQSYNYNTNQYQDYNTHYQRQNYNQNTIYTPKKPIHVNEPKYCSYCEEVYKYTIVNNLPLKIITCVYCQTKINQITLDHFLSKYKKDLYENYSHKLNEIDTNSFIQETPKKKRKRTSFYSLISSSSPPHYDSVLQSEPSSLIKYPPLPKRRLGEINKDKTFSEKLNVSENNISLAQAFKQRHSGIINKMEKRALSVKDNSFSTSRDILEFNLQKDKRYKEKLSKSVIKVHSRNNSEVKNNSAKRSNNFSTKNITNSNIKPKKIREPSSELINRLIHGQKAKMTQKEMRELNKRLIKNLAEVKYQKIDDQKQKSLSKLSAKKVQYTQVIKLIVIYHY